MLWPDKAQYRPGEPIRLTVNGAATRVRIRELGQWVAELAVTDGEAEWTAPAGYERAPRGFALEAINAEGELVGTSALDVAAHWSLAPRYGFLSEFAPGTTTDAVEGLLRLHLNVAQYYDWMYTHYQFFAETAEFVDPLGRPLSHKVVAERVAACHAANIACLAYGALYGGERAIAEAHPDWLLRDGTGKPYALGDFFYIQDPSQGSGWRELILDQFAAAVTRLGFDGIHIDQYGWPKRALRWPAAAELAPAEYAGPTLDVDLGAVLPDFVQAAGERVQGLTATGGNIFNCVNNWPVEGVAPLSAHAATYIEVWAPNVTYGDLHQLIRHARACNPQKQVILAAYLPPFHKDSVRPAGAVNALRLTSAAIWASGGFHLLLGEGDGALAHPYYPNFGRLDAAELAVAQAYYDFTTAYGELLFDQELRDVTETWMGGINEEVKLCGVPTATKSEPGKVWTLLKEKAGRRVLHLINLTGLADVHWEAAQPDPSPVEGHWVELQVWGPVEVWLASPDTGGRAEQLTVWPDPEGSARIRLQLPTLRTWQMLWFTEG